MKCIINWTELSMESGGKFIQQAKPITDEEYSKLISFSSEQLNAFIREKFQGNPMCQISPTIQDYKTEEKRAAFLSNFPIEIE